MNTIKLLFHIAIGFVCGAAAYAAVDEWKRWDAKWKSRRESELLQCDTEE